MAVGKNVGWIILRCSCWRIRSPVVADAAGVWPFEGVFICALDIATGKLIWRNERLGYLFGTQPHETKAIGKLAPQGYLIVDGENDVADPNAVDRMAFYFAALGLT